MASENKYLVKMEATAYWITPQDNLGRTFWTEKHKYKPLFEVVNKTCDILGILQYTQQLPYTMQLYTTQACKGKIRFCDQETKEITHDAISRAENHNAVWVKVIYDGEEGRNTWSIACILQAENTWECLDDKYVSNEFQLRDVSIPAQVFFEPLIQQWQQKQQKHEVHLLKWFFSMAYVKNKEASMLLYLVCSPIESYLNSVKPDWNA